MDNAQKAIMIGVAVFITILIIAIILLVTNTGTNLAKAGVDNISKIDNQLANKIIQNYNNKELNATDVATAIDTYSKDLNNNIIVVVFPRGTTGYAVACKIYDNTATRVANLSLIGVNVDGKYINASKAKGYLYGVASPRFI